MKITAIADVYLPREMLEDGLAGLSEAGHDVTFLEWGPDTGEEIQEINLDIEQNGPNGYDLPEDIAAEVKDSDVVIIQFAPIGEALIQECDRLKVIGVLRGGMDNVDRVAAEAKGIQVVNTPGRNARAVAEFTVGMILAETRNIARTHAAMMQNVWLKEFPNSDDIPELEGKTLGVVGAGPIGDLVMKFMSALDMKCLFYDPYTDSSDYGIKVDTLEELAAASDVFSLHARLTEDNYHMVNQEILDLLKPSAVFVNMARSGLVDEQALIKTLRERKIAGAAIDTFDDEPLPADSPWLTLDNVTITSHIAGTTRAAFLKTPYILTERVLKALEQGEAS